MKYKCYCLLTAKDTPHISQTCLTLDLSMAGNGASLCSVA